MAFPPPPPPAPMPPNQGPFAGVPQGMPPGAIRVDDFHASPFPDEYDQQGGGWDDWDDQGAQSSKKNKKNKGKEDEAPVKLEYEGYMLEKADPRTGEKYSWARVGKRALPFDHDKLQSIVKEHRKRTRTSPQSDFMRLSSNQQGIIDRIIADRKLNEKNKNADWVLADVQRFGKWHWTSMEVKKVQVVIKRIDKNQIKNGEHTTRGNSKSYQFGEIVDLADPLERKNEKGGKKNKKSRSVEDLTLVDDPLGLGLGPPMPQHHNNHHPPQDQFAQPMMPPPPPGFGPMPGDPNQFHPQQPPMPPQPPQMSARNSFQGNPFQPNSEFAAPGQFESPPMHAQDFPHPHQGPREPRRSQSGPRRRDSKRRPSMDARRYSQHPDDVDDLRFKMDNWNLNGGSSEGSYDDDGVFSPPLSEMRDFSPPSSPISQFSEGMPRGSLERRKSYGRDLRYHPRYRSHKYRDVEIEPEYNSRSDGRRYSPESRRHSSRPRLRQTVTYDDYPSGRAADPLYLPAPRRPQRRLTDFDDRYEHDEHDDMKRRDSRDTRRRSVVNYDPYREAYEAGRRDSVRDTRRQSFVGGGGSGGGYYH